MFSYIKRLTIINLLNKLQYINFIIVLIINKFIYYSMELLIDNSVIKFINHNLDYKIKKIIYLKVFLLV